MLLRCQRLPQLRALDQLPPLAEGSGLLDADASANLLRSGWLARFRFLLREECTGRLLSAALGL